LRETHGATHELHHRPPPRGACGGPTAPRAVRETQQPSPAAPGPASCGRDAASPAAAGCPERGVRRLTASRADAPDREPRLRVELVAIELPDVQAPPFARLRDPVQ